MSDYEGSDYEFSDSDSSSNSEKDVKPKKKIINKIIENENDEENSIIEDSDDENDSTKILDSDDEDDDEDEISYYDEEENEEEEEETEGEIKKVGKPNISLTVSHQEESDEEDEEENYLQKFERDINEKYIQDNHPECVIHNFDEVLSLCQVVRNKEGLIIDDLHKTVPILTKYERARVLGQRSKQIESGSKPFVKVPENIVEAYLIAEMELREKKIPFIIRRPIPGGKCEYWHLKDLENICF